VSALPPVGASPRRDPSALDAAFALVARQVADGTAPFAILAIADREGPVRVAAFPGPDAPGVRRDSLCLLASITKPIVATGVMQLVAAGEVGLTDPVDRYIPGFAAAGKPEVTIWHLLTHTSGIPDFDFAELLRSGVGRTELLRRSTTASPAFAPGTRFEYVSSTFDLLAAVVERVTGERHAAHLRRAVLRPLGMLDTTFYPWDLGARLAPLFIATPPGIGPSWLADSRTDEERRAFAALELAGGGLFGTAGDLMRFGRAMLRGGELDGSRILAPAFVDLMTREQTNGGIGDPGDPILATHYGLGWAKPDPRTSPASASAFGHGGLTGTTLWVDPAHDLVVVYLTGVFGHPARPRAMVLQAVYSALG
jgi:CubicO group peptidase (beta-lactamase class C family)